LSRNTFDVIIIGAGVVGSSIAYHLAKRGCHDVLILEKSAVGSGASGVCPGGIRQQFSEEINTKLSIESVAFFKRFEEETGQPADFHQHGYLILATREEELAAFQHNVARQRQWGIEVSLLSPEEAKAMVPELNVSDVTGATFCPQDGYADPHSVVSGFSSAARRLGVKIKEETEVSGIDLQNNKVTGVSTPEGKFEAPVVVDAAGGHASVIGKMAGLDLPVHPSRRHVFITEPVFNHARRLSSLDRPDLPMVVEFNNGFWFRREGSCLIFGMRNPDEPEGFNTMVDWGFFTDTLAQAACRRLPALHDIGIMRGQAGLHSDTPDCMAIVGGTVIDGFYLACGFSGHGFMHSPAVGRLMADLILDGKVATPDISPLSPDRFQRKAGEKETVFI